MEEWEIPRSRLKGKTQSLTRCWLEPHLARPPPTFQMYSKGGGYVGSWREGSRDGWGVSIYAGKWGYDRWEGPFAQDLPHGVGRMFNAEDPGGEGAVFEFLMGRPATGDP